MQLLKNQFSARWISRTLRLANQRLFKSAVSRYVDRELWFSGGVQTFHHQTINHSTLNHDRVKDETLNHVRIGVRVIDSGLLAISSCLKSTLLDVS